MIRRVWVFWSKFLPQKFPQEKLKTVYVTLMKFLLLKRQKNHSKCKKNLKIRFFFHKNVPQRVALDAHIAVLTAKPMFFCQKAKFFYPKSGKIERDLILLKNCFLSQYCSGHVERSLDKPADGLSPKRQKSFVLFFRNDKRIQSFE